MASFHSSKPTQTRPKAKNEKEADQITNLHYDALGFFLRNALVLLQVEIQVVAWAILKDCAEGVVINGE